MQVLNPMRVEGEICPLTVHKRLCVANQDTLIVFNCAIQAVCQRLGPSFCTKTIKGICRTGLQVGVGGGTTDIAALFRGSCIWVVGPDTSENLYVHIGSF